MNRNIFIFVLVLVCGFSVYAATDIGTTGTFKVSAQRTVDSAVDSSAVVYTVTSDDIQNNHFESLSDAIGTVGAASINKTGTLGSLQNANVNGMGSGRTLVYLDGTLVTTAYDNNFDLNAIPVSAIEKVEIITSGSSKNGNKIAAGGVISITTKKPSQEPSLIITFENGSFMPAAQGIGALIDSQDLHATYADTINGKKILLSLGGMRAGNKYSYKADNYGIDSWTVRKNADTWAGDFLANVSGSTDDIEYSSNNLIRYQHLGVPGSLAFGLTDKDYQNNLLLNSANKIKKDSFSLSLNYTYNPVLIYYTASSNTKDSHFKHNLSSKAEYEYIFNDNFTFTPFAEAGLEIAKSTSLEKTQLRFYPKTGFSATLSFGNLALYPSADIGYTTDMKKWFPNASIGAEFELIKNLDFIGNISFAHRLPTFSDLFWPFTDYGWGFTYQGNPNLKPEKAFSADLGIKFDNQVFNASFDWFTRWVNDLILTSADYSTMENLDNALYMGFNSNAGINIENFSASIGWFFNKSFDLTNGNSISDDKPINNVRLHTLTFKASYRFEKLLLSLDGKYMGKYHISGKEYDGAFILNTGLDYTINDNFRTYLKIDNILNNQYQLSDGYPMPGLKVRIGGTWSIK